MSKDYIVLRPPLAKTFELPSREKLLELKPGDTAKIRFQVAADSPERMWVTLKDCSDEDLWLGVVDNDAAQKTTAKVLPAGTEVKFHPLDIIQLPNE